MPSDKDWDLMMTDRISIEIIESTKHWNVKDEVFNNEIKCHILLGKVWKIPAGGGPVIYNDLTPKMVLTVVTNGGNHSCKKLLSWYLRYHTFFQENSDILKILTKNQVYLAIKTLLL